MNLTKNTLSSVAVGLIIAFLGAYLIGFTFAFTMPSGIVNFMWAWDILVVQFLGFGLLAIVSSYSVAYLTKHNFLFSVIATFIIAQISLFLMAANNLNLYWPNILTVLVCLNIGWFVACKKYV